MFILLYISALYVVYSLNSKLETLPNEIFLLLFSYMNQSDIVRGFFNLNRRIDLTVLECVRYLNIHRDAEFTWFTQLMPYIGSKIEMIKCNVESAFYLFLSNYSYPNLHTVILHNERFDVTLNVKDCSPLNTVIRCLSILRLCNFWATKNSEHLLVLGRDIMTMGRDEKV